MPHMANMPMAQEDMPSHSLFPMDRPSIPDQAFMQDKVNERVMAYPMDYVLDQEVASMVAMRLKASEYWRREKRIVWDKCWDHYRQVYDATGKENWQSRIFIPETTKVVETIVANLHATSMAPHTPIEYQANLPQLENAVKDHNSIISNDFDRSKFKVSWTDFLRQLAILGTSVGKIEYRKELRKVLVKERNRMASLNPLLKSVGADTNPQEFFREQEMKTKDWAELSVRDLYDIYPEPYTFEIDDKHWIIEKAKITNYELIAGANDPDPAMRLRNVTPALLSISNDTRIQADPEKQARRLALMQQQVNMNYKDHDSPHELFEYWGPVPEVWMFPDRRNDPEAKYRMVPGWIWVVDKQWVVRKQLNPFRDAMPPYVRGHYIRVPGQWYGIGVAEIMIGLQIETNELRNTRVDQTNLTLNKIMAVLKDKIPPGEWQRLRSEPGAIWLFEGIDDIKKALEIIEYPPAGQDAYLNSNEIKQQIQEVTAATNATIGVGGQEGDSGGKTFRGQLLNKQSSSDRFMLYERVLEICGLAEATRKYYQRIYQYKDYDSVPAILGPDKAAAFEFIPPELLDQYAKLVPLGAATVESKGVKLAQLEAFANQWKMNWWFKGIDVARKELTEMGYPNSDQFIFSDEEVQQYNEARKAAMAEAGPITEAELKTGPEGRDINVKTEQPSGKEQPIAGNSPLRTREFGPRPAMPARGPGVSPIDSTGAPLG